MCKSMGFVVWSPLGYAQVDGGFSGLLEEVFNKHHCADSWGAIPLCYVDCLERMKPKYLIPYKGLSIGLWS